MEFSSLCVCVCVLARYVIDLSSPPLANLMMIMTLTAAFA